MKEFSFIIIFVFFAFLCSDISFAQNSNAGFIKSNIWYSTDNFEEGDKIKIYTVIFNPDERELSGNVSFYDGSILLGKKSFSVTSRKIIDISIDWTVTAGNHSIYARIEKAQFYTNEGGYTEVILGRNETEKNESFVPKKIILSKDSNENTNIISDGKKIISNVSKNIVNKFSDSISTIATNSVSGRVNNIVKTIEDFRQDTINWSKNIKEEAKNSIENKEENQDELPPQKINQAKFLLASTAEFMFDNKTIFYGIPIVLIILISRFLLKKFLIS
ncbi:MAG: hypothetical protein WCX79_03310 [Candidatus Paceibacterota bacterium]|jgi:hypothetical protein